jgi:hypothetical protein
MFETAKLPRRTGGGLLAGACASAVAAVAIAAGAASESASAGSRVRSPLYDLPTAEAELRAPAQVLAEAPLWKFLSLETCNETGTTCFANLPRVPANERWEIRFVSCTTDTQLDASFRHFSLQVYNGAVTKLLGYHFLAATYQSPRDQAAVYVASQPIVMAVEAGNVLYMTALSSGSMGTPDCNITGVRQKLG